MVAEVLDTVDPGEGRQDAVQVRVLSRSPPAPTSTAPNSIPISDR